MTNQELFSYVDHTLLKPEATPEQIAALCAEAAEHGTASVCVREGCRVFYGAEVQKTRPPGFPRRAQCGLWVFTFRSRPGPCGGSGGPPGRGGSWRG